MTNFVMPAKAEKFWETPGKPGNVAGKETEEATEPMVGVVDFDGKGVYFAEHDDQRPLSRQSRGARHARAHLEAGSANVYRMRLTRQK